jgi:predicted permease
MEPGLSREIDSHLALLEEQYKSRGMSREDAHRAARLAFGGVERAKELHRGERSFGWLDDFSRDIRYASRTLRRNPGFAVVAIITVALGIGANTAIFAVVNAILLRSLPYPNADQIVAIRHHAPGLTRTELYSSPGLIAYYRKSARMVASIVGYEGSDRNLTGIGPAARIRAVAVSPELFDVLGTQPALGRRFYESDVVPNARPVVLLTHQAWQSRFGGDVGVLRRTIDLDGRRAEIIGVMPPAFAFPDHRTELLLPLWIDPNGIFGDFGTITVAKLASGATLERAREEMNILQRGVSAQFGIPPQVFDGWRWSVTTERLQDRIIGNTSRPLWILLGSVGLILLIAGGNVANLFLVRMDARRRELAVATALGASRGRLAQSFVTESVLLSLIGGVMGVLMAIVGVQVLVAYGPAELPRLHEIRVDGRVVTFAALLSLLTGGIVGTLPLFRLPRLVSAGLLLGRTTGGRETQRARQVFVMAQVALAAILVVACGLMLRTVKQLYAVDPGVQIANVTTAGVSVYASKDRARAVRLYQRMLDEVGTLPGILSIGATNDLPIEAVAMNGSSIGIASRPQSKEEPIRIARYKAVTAGYFETMNMPLYEGRTPEHADSEQNRLVAWVNRTFAREFLDNRALGERISIEGKKLEIVGVVGDVREFGLREAVRPTAYVPLSVTVVPIDVMHIVARTTETAPSLADTLRTAVGRVDPSAPIMAVRTMDDVVASSLAETSLTMTLLSLSAGMAVLLGVVGLYGVTRYIVNQRTNEIGVRLALGAHSRHVCTMILRQSLTAALVGIVVGLGCAYALTRVMTPLLFEVSAHDPVTFVTGAIVLAVVSVVATYLPAYRATRVSPLLALRYE